DSGRALDLHEQNLDLVVQVADFKVPAVERAIFDLAAIVIGYNLAPTDAPTDEHAFRWKRIAELAPAGRYEIRRPSGKRRGECRGGDGVTGNGRFGISGQKPVRCGGPGELGRAKMVLKKFSGSFFIQRNGLTRVLTNVLQRSRDRGQIPSRVPTPVLQRPA